MYQIKFRIWNNRSKFWITEQELDSFTGFKKLNDVFTNKDLVFQQYTNLKDRNGREIYDGDIVKYSDVLWRIEWEGCRWVAVGPFGPDYVGSFRSIYSRFSDLRISTVEGNIFENYDLIENG
jgi:hypothetical protein